MISKKISFKALDGKELYGFKWSPDNDSSIKGVVQVVHGMAETASRYERFALNMCEGGYIVYAFDQRGHGATAGSLENVGYIADRDSFEVYVEDQHGIFGLVRKENSGLPVFLFGHSMGSFVGQGYIQKYGNELAGVILSGSNGKQGLLLSVGKLLAASEVKKIGRKAPSPKMNKLSFGSFNNAFRPNRTAFDWLSSDETEVDKYINDPYCGGIFSAGFFADMTVFLTKIQKPENVRNVPINLPVLLISGALDPVSNGGKGVVVLNNTYRKHGIKDLSFTLYPKMRHELLNEVNRGDVMADVLGWFNRHLPGDKA